MTLERVLTTERRDLRLAIPALAAWGFALFSVNLSPPLWVGGILAVAALIIGWVGSRRKARWMPAVVSIAIVGAALCTAVSLGNVARTQPQLKMRDGQEVLVQVTLEKTAVPGASSHPVRIVGVDGIRLEHGPVLARAVGPLGEERISVGSTVEFTGFVRAGKPWESARWVVMIRDTPKILRGPPSFVAGADALRAEFLELSLSSPGDAGGLLPGLAIGDTSRVDPGLEHAMRVTSLSHLMAVSGANCAIVVGLVVWVVRLCRGGPWLRMGAGLVALAGFVVLVTPEPSIIRASLMAAIVLVSLALERPIRGLPVLSATVVALLAFDPWLSTSFAFPLSVAATTGILMLTGPLTRILTRVVPKTMAVGLSLPVAAQMACMPILILLSPAIPTWGVIANAMAAPVAPFATIIGMLACLVSPFFPSVASLLISVAWIPTSFIAGVGRMLAEWPMAAIPWPPGWFGAASLALASYAAMTWLAMTPPRPEWASRILAGIAVVSLGLVVGSFGVPTLLKGASVPQQWTLAQCDVGQGDSLVVRSKGTYMLIDTGASEDALRSCLSLLQVPRLDLVVVTHFDKDHVGAWGSIAHFDPEIWVGSPADERKADFLSDFQRAALDVSEVHSGQSVRLGEYTIEVVWPEKVSIAEQGNDSSIVLRMVPDPGCATCLEAVFLGDLGEEPQRILAGRLPTMSPDVVKVSHHGSPDQFVGLYEELGAQISLIGVGEGNTYGHPARSLVDVLADFSLVLRTDQVGTSTLHKSDTGDIVVWSESHRPER